jgi:hypothetical protein
MPGHRATQGTWAVSQQGARKQAAANAAAEPPQGTAEVWGTCRVVGEGPEAATACRSEKQARNDCITVMQL